uniref:Sigma-54-dependent Fis family transcriptional regulator n=1 Tax=Fervidobacterium thailandense TaxID=1008305 RepID=A0A7C4RWT7_9BACT
MKKIFVQNDLTDVIMEILKSLDTQFAIKNEKMNLENMITSAPEDLDECFLYIGRLEEKYLEKLKEKEIIVIFEKQFEAELFEHFLELEIIGVFRKERLKVEFEEKGKLEKLLKESLRKQNYRLKFEDGKYYQEVPYKIIKNWKFSVKINDPKHVYERIKFVSIFLDPTMQSFSRALRKIIQDFRRVYRTYFPNYAHNNHLAVDGGSTYCKRYEITSKKIHESLQKELEKCKKELLKNHKVFSLPSLLIEGETGTGKSLIAEIIARSVLNDEAFQTHFKRISLVNIGKELVDGALFGSVKGAYTSAEDDKLGIILENIFGILFLDEIAEVPPEVQAKLLIYMDDYMVRPLGFDKGGIFAPVSIIAATNKDLKKEIAVGNFRSDLYHRFKYKLYIPPLRERKEDIRFLVNFVLLNPIINPVDENGNYAVDKISLEAINILENYDYPGNFRELEEILRNAVNNALVEGLSIILPRHIELRR